MRPIPTEPMLDNCTKCGRETRHEPDRDGKYHCTVCPERERVASIPARNRAALVAVGTVAATIIVLMIAMLVTR